MSALANAAVQAQKQYKNGAFVTGSFLENHDQPRFQSITQDQALVKNAMMWPFVHDSIPVLYYGQEQGYTGNSDPNNREALWLTAFDTSKSLVGHVKSLNAARKAAMAANGNYTTVPMSFLMQSNNATLVVRKPPLVALLTNVGNSSKATTTWTIPGSSGVFKGGESVVNVLDCKTLTVASDGGLSVSVESGMPQLLLPASMLSKSGDLCPKVASGKSGAGFSARANWSVIGGVLVFALVKLLV